MDEERRKLIVKSRSFRNRERFFGLLCAISVMGLLPAILVESVGLLVFSVGLASVGLIGMILTEIIHCIVIPRDIRKEAETGERQTPEKIRADLRERQEKYRETQKVLFIALFVSAVIFLPVALYFSELWAFLIAVGLVFVIMIAIFIVHRKSFPPELQKELQAESERIARDNSTPVAAKLLDIEVVTGSNKSNMATRGLVGGLIFGTVGAAYGMATAKREIKEENAYFLVEYKSGRIDTEIVSVGSARFNQLIALAKEE